MPRLHQRSDGGYYIKAWYTTVGFCTYQVLDAGVAQLAELKYLYEGAEIPDWLLAELRAEGFVFTGQSGVSPPRADDVGEALEQERPLVLRIFEDDSRWSLELLLPELPREYLTDYSAPELIDLLRDCGLRVAGEELPAVRLLPGKDNMPVPVVPSEKDYCVEAIGPWPASWSLRPWLRGARGLAPAGTVFCGPDGGGERLRAGDPMELGEEYYLACLCHEELSPPPGVECQLVGYVAAWKAYRIRLPGTATDSLRSWCLRLGHPLERQRCRLRLVCPPPHRYLVDGTPVVTSRHATVFVAELPDRSPEMIRKDTLTLFHNGYPTCSLALEHPCSKGPLCVIVRAALPGRYRITGSCLVAGATYEVLDDEPMVDTEYLAVQPLRATVSAGDVEEVVSSWAGTPSSCQFTLDDCPKLTVECAVPTYVTVDQAGRAGLRDVLTAEQATERLALELPRVWSLGEPFVLQLDAGVYGSIGLLFRHQASQVARSELSSRGTALCRWAGDLSSSPHWNPRFGRRVPASLAGPGFRGILRTPMPWAHIPSWIYNHVLGCRTQG